MLYVEFIVKVPRSKGIGYVENWSSQFKFRTDGAIFHFRMFSAVAAAHRVRNG